MADRGRIRTAMRENLVMGLPGVVCENMALLHGPIQPSVSIETGSYHREQSWWILPSKPSKIQPVAEDSWKQPTAHGE